MNSARSLDTLFELNQLATADKKAAKPAPSADFKAVKLDSKSSAAPVSLGSNFLQRCACLHVAVPG